MKFNLYAVLDSKVQAFLHLHTYRNDGEAIRAFCASIEDTKTNFYKWPEDFTLCRVGTYDEESGKVEGETAPVSIVKAVDFHPRNRTPEVSHNNPSSRRAPSHEEVTQ